MTVEPTPFYLVAGGCGAAADRLLAESAHGGSSSGTSGDTSFFLTAGTAGIAGTSGGTAGISGGAPGVVVRRRRPAGEGTPRGAAMGLRRLGGEIEKESLRRVSAGQLD